MHNLKIILRRPQKARIKMEATTPGGFAICYNQSHQESLRVALALKATDIHLSELH